MQYACSIPHVGLFRVLLDEYNVVVVSLVAVLKRRRADMAFSATALA